MKLYGLLVLSFLLSFYLTAQDSETMIIKESISLDFNTNRGVKIYHALFPDVKAKQKVLKRKFSVEPEKIVDKDGVKYAVWEVTGNQSYGRIQVGTALRVYSRDLEHALKNPVFEQNIIRVESSKEGRFIDLDQEELVQIADENEGATDLETLENHFNYVYKLYELHPDGKLSIDEGKKPKITCREYSDLFISLCQVSNIPAHYIRGHYILDNAAKGNHTWVEVFTPEEGWFHLDATFAHSHTSEGSFKSISRTLLINGFERNMRTSFRKGLLRSRNLKVERKVEILKS